MLSINNNSAASSILSNLNNVQNEMTSSYQQLSTGNKVNSAADNPASYAISQQMTSQVNGLNQATQNAQNGISMIQTATGAMNQVEQVLQTMGTLATESSNAGNTFSDRANLQLEMNALAQQINSTTNQTQYNGVSLLTGQFGTTSGSNLQLQIGANEGQTMSFNINATDVQTLGVNGTTVASGTATHLTSTEVGTGIAASGTGAIASGISTPSGGSLFQGGQQLELVFTANIGAASASNTAGSITGGTLQLESTDGTKIGSAVSLTSGQIGNASGTSVTVGDSATGAQLTISTNDLKNLVSISSGNAAGTFTTIDKLSLTGNTPNSSGTQANGWQAATNVVGINIMDQNSAQSAITSIQNAINTMSSSQATLGAVQNRLNYTVSNLGNSSQNLQNAQSTITNTDMASAYTKFSQQQVLQQVGISMLSQAQQQPSMILKLLQ